jgi:hypothetical protein
MEEHVLGSRRRSGKTLIDVFVEIRRLTIVNPDQVSVVKEMIWKQGVVEVIRRARNIQG